MSDTNGLAIRLDDGILRIVIDRPHRMNAVTTEVLNELTDTFERYALNPTVRTAILTGRGQAFCSGADLTTVTPGATPASHRIDAANRVVSAIRTFPRPVIGVVNGPAVGVGVCLALACDLTIVAESAFFLLAFTKVGLMPDGGATALVAASIGRARAMKLALLAERFEAHDALSAGLIGEVCPDDELTDRVESVARRLSNGPCDALHATKLAINDATLTELEAAFDRERDGQLMRLAGEEYIEGVAAFLEKRPAIFRRAEGTQVPESPWEPTRSK
ncbi:enoyl-CoA hydratase [Rhodococcus sp. ARC_M6]|uniref:enoyl-CoA hydratase n=1 Tax=Rhodococcus sp. ARC_M6 TaxID=2928852 RepID=UPI001FB1BB41|nr:enoyl-CoA hydratase [Rhodococcus sp. ARC_M6]MCJ0907498.1 enoyl-CoA hydratase [Rhodococcus sp. ARC_M6]